MTPGEPTVMFGVPKCTFGEIGEPFYSCKQLASYELHAIFSEKGDEPELAGLYHSCVQHASVANTILREHHPNCVIHVQYFEVIGERSK